MIGEASLTAWLPVLGSLACKSLLVFAVAVAALWGLCRASAALRHLVCLLTLAALLVLPALSLTLPSWRLSIPAAAALTEPLSASGPLLSRLGSPPSPVKGGHFGSETPIETDLPFVSGHNLSQITSPPLRGEGGEPKRDGRGLPHGRGSWLIFLPALWLLGLLLAVLRPLLGLWGIAHLSRVSVPVVDADVLTLAGQCASALRLTTTPILRQADAPVPMTWGGRRPVVLLPLNAHAWPEERLRAVLLHELAHVRRQDWLSHRFANLVCTLYWFHPFVWLTARRLRAESEIACDDLVLTSGLAAPDYARHLLEVARALRPASHVPRAAIAMARTTRMEGRLRMILNPAQSRRAVTRRALLSVVTLGSAALILLAVLRPAAKAQPVSALSPVPLTLLTASKAVAPVGLPSDQYGLVYLALPDRSHPGRSHWRWVLQRDGNPSAHGSGRSPYPEVEARSLDAPPLKAYVSHIPAQKSIGMVWPFKMSDLARQAGLADLRRLCASRGIGFHVLSISSYAEPIPSPALTPLSPADAPAQIAPLSLPASAAPVPAARKGSIMHAKGMTINLPSSGKSDPFILTMSQATMVTATDPFHSPTLLVGASDLKINGTTLLVGVTNADKPGDSWWSANGALLPTPVYDTTAYRAENHAGHETNNVIFALRLPAAAQDVTIEYDLPQSVRSSSDGFWPTKMQDNAQRTEAQIFAKTGGARVVTAAFPPALKKANLRISIAVGAWKTIATINAATNPSGLLHEEDGVKVLLSPLTEAIDLSVVPGPPQAVLTVATDTTDDLRVVAIDMQGREVLPLGIGGNSIGTLDQITARFGLRLSQIKEVRVQTRKFQRIELKNIALQPVK